MKEYIVRKILRSLLTLFAIVTTLFILFHVLPIDNTAWVISQALDETSRHRLKLAFGLDKPMYVQYIQNKMLEVIDNDFVLMARAKGLAPHLVIFKHAARNAIMAVVALSSPMIGFAVSGQLTVEQAFNWPGLGRLLVQSAASHDYPVLQATFFVLAALVIFLNLVTDISYSYLNPRIKIEGIS